MRLTMTLSELSKECHAIALKSGFYCPQVKVKDRRSGDDDLMLGKLMLVVTEVSEAAEALRKGDIKGFWDEIGDTFIRLFDICGANEVAIEPIVQELMRKNRERPFRHAKVTRL